MNKPTLQREVTVCASFEPAQRTGTGIIRFYATADAVTDFSDFGKITPWNAPNEYQLEVDPRYDFSQVLNYIQSYGTEK